jgi:ubiquinone/menaquinone biosynthesis C-methylase UbiE
MTAPDLFESAAFYYARYRPGYPEPAFDAMVKHLGLGAATRVLDLGCGTGQIGIPLARRGVPVSAVDPDVEMLCEGLRAEQRANLAGIAWQRGDDKSIDQLGLPPIKACTMGASFHWMDRDGVLQKLDRMVDRGGGVAVLSGGSSVWSDSDEAWQAIAKQVIVDFLGPERRAGEGRYGHPADRHEVVLCRSAFSKVENCNSNMNMLPLSTAS